MLAWGEQRAGEVIQESATGGEITLKDAGEATYVVVLGVKHKLLILSYNKYITPPCHAEYLGFLTQEKNCLRGRLEI